MKDTLKKLDRKRVLISIILVILFVLMIGLIALIKPVNKTIKISKVLSDTKTLSASVIDGVQEGVTSNNYDEIKYQIRVNKDSSDTAIVTATLTNEENKYARFKGNKEGVVTNNGKEITITTTKSNISITVIVENAPYGVTINPKININSEDTANSKINVDPVTITGKSVEGQVTDDNGTIFSGIELVLTKNGNEVKRTYTKEDGKYVFSLGDLDTYEVKLAETKYKLVRYTDETTDQNRKVLNVVIKEVEPFTLNIKKTISKLDLVVNGKKETFDYDDETRVIRVIRNAKTIEGSIYYNIAIKNEGEVRGTVAVLKDVLPDGLSFDESKNPGWTKEDNYLFYSPIEGTELEAFEKTSAKLVLDIAKTDEAKSYINKAIAAGDDYKYIVYYLNGSVYKEEYVINSEKIENIDPHVENFAGWYTDRNYTNKYDFDKTVTKDIALYGKIDNNKFNVTFIDKNPNNDAQTILDIKEVNEGDSVDLIDHPEYNGYTFKCFTLNDVCYNGEEIVSDTELYTSYTINNYEIEYNLDGGSVNPTNPTSYTVRDTFILNNPTKEGFTFLGWTGTDLTDTTETVTIPVGSTGKKTYTAHYEINRSTLTIDPNGGTYESNVSLVTFTENFGTLKILSESERRGYNFLRYNHDGGGTYNNLTYLFDNDDATLTAIYEIINYRINYQNITDEERDFLRNKTEYNVETETFTLSNPSTRLDNQGNNYQDFLGWDDGNGNVSLTVTISKGSIGDRTYTAVWRENQDDYAITYELHGGAYEAGKTNPPTYTRQTATFTLNNPSKEGYNFTGWTGTGLTVATETVTIPQGSSGDRAYEATYEVIPYEIHYHGLTPEEETTLNNPTGYNVESAPITLANPTRTGYEFIGWSGTDITDKSTSVVIPTGSTGNRDYTANFRKLDYSLTYTLNGGTYEEGKTNPDRYSIDSDPITLNNPSKVGYTFKGWSGTDLTGDENTVVTIPTGSIGHRSFLANYTPIVYTITYDYDGGALPQGVTNPDRYTIESDEITFNAPEKEGYTFTHYTMGSSIITSIPTGSTGDKNLKANYEINHFTVNYYNESVQFATETVDWKETATKPATDPTKAHNIFLYWSEDGTTEYDFSTLITANKNLYAVYEEVLTPVIALNPLLDETTNKTWVCSNSSNSECGVLVTITNNENLLDATGYELYYQVGDGSPVLYTEPFKVYENTTITAFAKKSNIYSENTTKDVVNVDSIAPTINNPATGAMSFNMSVSGTAQDADSGVKQFTLYVKEKTALEFDDTLTYTSEVFDGIKDHAENYDHTFYGVHENTEYVVKIVAVDYVGNVSEKEVEVTTHPYVARVVGKNGMLWYTVDPDTKEFVLEDGKEFLMFDSIQAAVNYCAEVQCTIQTNPVYPVVTESVIIGQNQNITIDLDGRIITSSEEATFINNGELHIVDRNPRLVNGEHESIGKVTNTTGKAVINNKKFVLGDGSSEASETFIYPELDRPIIEGYETAIEQNDTFYFFDGKLVSDTIALIDNGEDPITQYSYNVVITGENDKHIGTLSVVDDPEARIKSTYYTKLKVNTGDNAFDSARTGTITTESAKILSKIKQYGDYGFIYDAVNDEIYNGNSSTANTTAISYLKIDLTDEIEDKMIIFDTFADTYDYRDYGYISISDSLSNTGTQIYRTYGNDISGTKIHYLEKGKVYYIYFGFVKAIGDVNIHEVFKIKNIKILGERESVSGLTLFNDDTGYYPFKQNTDGSIVSTNGNIASSYSHSYVVYDLRNETDTVNLVIDSSISTSSGYDVGYIYTSNNTNFQEAGNSQGRYIYSTGNSENNITTIPLTPGTVTYVHFAFWNRFAENDETDNFKINSIYLYKSVSNTDIAPDLTLYHNSTDTYHFANGFDPYYWKAATGPNGIIYGATLNNSNDGYIFDGNDYTVISGGISSTFLNAETVQLEFSTTTIVNSVYYSGSGNERISIGVWDNILYVSNARVYGERPNGYVLPSNWADGNKHKLVVTYNQGVYNAYFDGTLLTKSNLTGSFPDGIDSSTYIGSIGGQWQFFTGTIYDVKVYNKEFAEEEISNMSSEDLILHLDASDSILLTQGYINNNREVQDSNAHSYIAIDLTNVDEDKYIYINTRISSEEGSDFGIIQQTNSSDYPSDNTGILLKVSGNYDDQSVIVKLKKNQINYIHFMYTKNWRWNSNSDTFVIKEIRYCNTLEDAYSIGNSNSYTNEYYFEKPVLNETVDTIEILKNITLDSTLVVPQEKEVILDLNGFTLTSNKNDYVIKNNGKLTIIDSDYNDRYKQNVDYKIEQARLFEEAKEEYFADLEVYNEYAGLCEGCEPSEEYKLDNSLLKEFSFKGEVQEYTLDFTGTYKVELWGAQGGNNNANFGKGAYTSGEIELTKGETLYIYVGEKGGSTNPSASMYVAGGYNGGGSTNGQNCCGRTYGSGGGATDVRYFTSTPNSEDLLVGSDNGLASRIMVAAGGGGGFNGSGGGNAGGLIGLNATTTNGYGPGIGATQTSGGINPYDNVANGSFGIGGSGGNSGLSTGGGGGYFGGSGSGHIDAAGGGSSYISGHNGSIAITSISDLTPKCTEDNTSVSCSEHFTGKVFTSTVMKAGNEEMPNFDNTDVMIGNANDGYAKIKYLISDEELQEMRENLPKTYTVKTQPQFSDYLTNIDIEDDISSLVPDDNPTYNNIVSDNVYGSITSTIYDVVLNEEYATLTINSGNININSNNKNAIINRGNLLVGQDGIINANNNGSVGIYNESNGDIVSFEGIINVFGNYSIGLLNRSNDSSINGVKVITNVSNEVAVENQALGNMTYTNANISGAGIGFREYSSGDLLIIDSNIKSTNNHSFVDTAQGKNGTVTINNTNLYGQFTCYESPKAIRVNSSTLSSVFNDYGYVLIDNSSINSIDNRGEMEINNSVIQGAETLITNVATGSPGAQYTSKLLIKGSTINSTSTSNDVTVINNYHTMTIADTKINNYGSAKHAAIRNYYRGIDPASNGYTEIIAHLNILGNTSIDKKFGTAIYNDGVLTLGTNQDYETTYNYSYTGHQEEFVAPATGTYKLETWGAQGGTSFRYLCGMASCVGPVYGGKGAYASGTIDLNEGDKLYIHVGGYGTSGSQSTGNGEGTFKAWYGAYNGGGSATGHINGWPDGAGGGATDISLSNEDNVWSYDNGLLSSKRSNASYAQRILVAGGGSGGNAASVNRYGGYNVDPSNTQLGYSSYNGGGGYYGGRFEEGGSSYASNILSNIELINGISEMPAYYGNGYMIGNVGYGYAKITLLDNNNDTVSNNPTISAINTGIAGSGKLIYYDGIINANSSVLASVDVVPDNYDIYISKESDNTEKMSLVANADSRPVSEGEEEFVCKIGNAKYTTIQNALDASNNGDTIVLLVNIDQQNSIDIPSNKEITIDYNGHRINTYSDDYLFNNAGTLTIKDSLDAKEKSIFYGDRYILNTGTLNISDIYVDDYTYAKHIIENNDGFVTINNVKFEFGNHSELDKYAIYNSGNGVITVTDSELRAFSRNRFFSNNGLLTITNTDLISNNSAPLVTNNETGTAILDGCTLRHENAHNNYGMYMLDNSGIATIKNMSNKSIFTIPNTGVLTLENNTITEGTINNDGLLIINSGTYNNIFNIRGTGKQIDSTEDLYSFIMHDGTINTTLNRTASGITTIESGSIVVNGNYAINNSGAGIINLGIHDSFADTKSNTRPIITGNKYGIYTENPSLLVNFYDGIITGNKSYNVTVKDIETGYSIKREYDSANDKEIKYLTNEPMFINATQNIMYNSVDELNNAISNSLVNSNDIIKVYRDITISQTDNSITIPNGLSITFDLNGKYVDKNNLNMFTINGELNAIDSIVDSEGLIDSTTGNIFENNNVLNISSGKYTSEKASIDSEVIKNNQSANLNISGGTFTKYHDIVENRNTYSGSIIINNGNALITDGTFVSNGSYVIFGTYTLYMSTVFTNNETGILNVTGGTFDGINGRLFDNDTWRDPNSTYVNKGALIYNYGEAHIKDITSEQSLIGCNEGTLSFDNVTMEHIVQIAHDRYAWISDIAGSNRNLTNTGNLDITNSYFELYNSLVDNLGGNITISNTTIDRISNGLNYGWYQRDDIHNKTSHIINNVYNTAKSNSITITNSHLYQRGSGELIDNSGTIIVKDSTLEALNNNVYTSKSGIINVDNSTIKSSKGAGINAEATNVSVFNNSSVISEDGNAININSTSTLIVGKPISEDNIVSQTYPVIKGTAYAVNNTNGTFKFYDGKLYGKTSTVNGITNNIEDGYAIVLGTEDDYNTAILDRVPIIQNITQATQVDEKKYYDLKTAFADAVSGDTLQMIANYNNLPIDETAVVNVNVTFDLNGFTIKEANDVLFENNATLNIKDTSSNKTGKIIAVHGTKTIDNNGTINFVSGKLESLNGVVLINNNNGATFVIKDEAIVESTVGTKLINNDGTLNIYNGAYLHNLGNIILNNNILNIIDLNKDNDNSTSSDLEAPWIYAEDTGGGTVFDSYESAPITTSALATTNIYGGIFNNNETYDNGSPTSAKIINNLGTTNIYNLDSYSYVLGYNSGTLNIEDSHFYNAKTGFLSSRYGTLHATNVIIDVTDFDGWVLSDRTRIILGTSTLDNVSMVNRNNGYYSGQIIYTYGPTSIKDSNFVFNGTDDCTLVNTSDMVIENTTFTSTSCLSNSGTINFDSTSLIFGSSRGILYNSGNVLFDNNSSVVSNDNNAIDNTGIIDINNSTSIISRNGYGINLRNDGIINIGEIGGVPDQSAPYIEGTTFGIYRDTQTSHLNFYDGLIVGQTGPNAIYGGVTNVEAGYETEDITVTDGDIQKHNEYLVVSASSVGIAKVGNYTFAAVGTISSSDALQNAINFATSGNTVRDVDLIAPVDLVNDEVSIVASQPVTINMNGFGINYNSTYYLSPNITLNTNSVGGNISRVIADIFNLSYNPKDVIIYEMSDGSKLDISNTYKLYKDDELVSLSKVEFGKYSYKGSHEDMTPIKGRLYINNLQKGSYRLVSSDNKYIEFSIDTDGNIYGNVAENTNNSSSAEAMAESEAELILTIQTGIRRHYYLIFTIPIILLLFLVIKISKNRVVNE